MKYARAFTLIELMVTIAVLAIFAAIAVPNGAGFIRSSRLTSTINGLMADFVLARTEASARGVPVAVCPATGPTGCSAVTGDWSIGHLIFADVDRSGSFTNGDTVLKYVSRSGGLVLTPAGFSAETMISFTWAGGLAGQTSGSFILCPLSGFGPHGRQLTMDLTGRPLAKRITTCT